MSITLSMIIKNEESFLGGCLDSVKGVVDEIVIVDTGSDDRSVEIAKNYKAKVIHAKWTNDFSEARNLALQHSTGDWILYLDADERLTESSKKLFKDLTSADKKLGIFCKVISETGFNKAKSFMKYLRLFKNSPGIKFTGRVHEQIEESLLNNGYQLAESDILIEHLGYNAGPEIIKAKAERNLKLLLEDYNLQPAGYTAFQIGQTYMVLNDHDSALPYFNEAVNYPAISNQQKAQSYRLMAAIFSGKNQPGQAEEYLKCGLALAPDIPILNLVGADIYFMKGDFYKAELFISRAFELRKKIGGGSSDSDFDILPEISDILMRGVQLSVLMANKKMFDYFYKESKSIELETVYRTFVELFKSLFVKEIPPRLEPQKLTGLNNFFHFQSFEILIEAIPSDEIKLQYLELIAANYSASEDFLKFKANLLFGSQKNEEAEKAFEELLNKFPLNPAPVFNLLSLYINNKKFNRATDLLDQAARVFAGNSEIAEKFETLRKKISNIS